ncbi:MAG TPA: ribonuclease HI [Spirochaetota bacterium]|nr:ribonuclease HI [Spirochaetota bacterium]
MSTKKFYAVAKGVRPGIYTNWPEAKAQIDGFAGALYKGFPTYKEAEEWLKKPVLRPASAKSGSEHPKSPACSDPRKDPLNPDPNRVTIYTDGGSSGNPGPGGYGVVQVYNGQVKEITGGFRHTTNNRMELMGVIVALRQLEFRDRPVTVYTDSSYVVNGITKGWAKSWRKNNWIKSDKQPAINPDLWSELLDLTADLDVAFVWVKGHAGNPLNERCDELAVSSAKQKGLPEDKGYRG